MEQADSPRMSQGSGGFVKTAAFGIVETVVRAHIDIDLGICAAGKCSAHRFPNRRRRVTVSRAEMKSDRTMNAVGLIQMLFQFGCVIAHRWVDLEPRGCKVGQTSAQTESQHGNLAVAFRP